MLSQAYEPQIVSSKTGMKNILISTTTKSKLCGSHAIFIFGKSGIKI